MKHWILVTGRLAKQSLEKIMARISPEGITYDIREMPVTVAGLMSVDMILRHIGETNGADQILVPGRCLGNLDDAYQTLGIPLERGPDELRDLPRYFGQKGMPVDLTEYETMMFAEIVDAPLLTSNEVLDQAMQYHHDGADVIDIGCMPADPFPALEAHVKILKKAGFQVSVDSDNPDLLIRGAAAGADYILSLDETTLDILDKVEAIPIIIPGSPGDLPSLYRAIDHCLDREIPLIADPILDPIHFGFVDSILRYREVRRRYPDIDILMGTGNLTELTEADTVGINTLLVGIISELGITHLLTTQVSDHARRSVAEIDLARRITYRAKLDGALPKDYHPGLTALHSRHPHCHTDEDIEELAALVKDRNFRIEVNESGIHIFNKTGCFTTTDPYAVLDRFPALTLEASHAFYMGRQLERANIAWQLGKSFVQDADLEWGCAVSSWQPPWKKNHKNHDDE